MLSVEYTVRKQFRQQQTIIKCYKLSKAQHTVGEVWLIACLLRKHTTLSLKVFLQTSFSQSFKLRTLKKVIATINHNLIAYTAVETESQ